MNFALRALLEVQETTLLAVRAASRLFRRPSYLPEMITQMDVIGVGSLTIILLTGFFTGGVLALQTYPTLKYYGAQDQTGRLVATALVRELGAVRLVALIITLPLLTLIADSVGIGGGWVVSTQFFGINSSSFMAAVWDGLSTDDIFGGFVKSTAFALIIGTVACRQGLSTEGGTVGVGRSTTSAVVATSILIIVADYFITRALQLVFGLPAG